MKKLEKKAMKQIIGGGGASDCRCILDTESPRCCWDFDVKPPYDCPKGSQYGCLIPYCWLLPCANPAGDGD